MAYMKRDRPGGSVARVAAGARTPTRTIVARVATRTALRRPESTRNVAPSYRDGAVSAPSDGRAAAVTAATGLGACGRGRQPATGGWFDLATRVAGRWGTVRIGATLERDNSEFVLGPGPDPRAVRPRVDRR